MSTIQIEYGYSAAVNLRLEIAGMIARVAQIGERFLILRDRLTAPPGTHANLIVTVDGDEIHYPIVLTDGIVAGSDWVDFADLENCKLWNATGEICTRTGPVRVQRGSQEIPSLQRLLFPPLPH
jgi:hypothetical protein